MQIGWAAEGGTRADEEGNIEFLISVRLSIFERFSNSYDFPIET